MSGEVGINVNILVKRENDLFVAHCLELDIVATGNTFAEAKSEIMDLIVAQVTYAFENDNLDNRYRPAPREAWEEFFKCKAPEEEKIQAQANDFERMVPLWIIAKTCHAVGACHA